MKMAHSEQCAFVFKPTDTQGALSKRLVNDFLLTWLEAFIIDRKAQTRIIENHTGDH